MAGAAFFLATGDVSANASGGALSVVQMLMVQSGLWLLLLLPWAALHAPLARGRHRGWLLLLALANVAFYALYTHALITIPVAQATVLLTGGTPFFVLLMVYVLFRLPPSRAEMAWIIVVVAGVGFVLHRGLGVHTLPVEGMASGAGAAFVLAFTFVALARISDESAHAINLWYAALTFFLCLPLFVASPRPSQPEPWSWAVLYGLLGLLGQTLLVWCTNDLGPTAGSMVAALVPVIAMLTAWGLLHGPAPGRLECVGAALVLAGCLGISREGARRPSLAAVP